MATSQTSFIKALTSLPGILTLRRSALAGLLELRGTSLIGAWLLLAWCGLFIHLFMLPLVSAGTPAPILQTALHTSVWVLYWGVVTFGLIEPLYQLLLRLSSLDEATLHWWPLQRDVTRLVIGAALSAGLLLTGLLSLALAWFSMGPVITGSLTLLLTYQMFARCTSLAWHFRGQATLIISFGPLLLVVLLLSPVLIHWTFAIAALVPALALLPWTHRDLHVRYRLKRRLDTAPPGIECSDTELLELLEDVHQSGAPGCAARILELWYGTEDGRQGKLDWRRVRLLMAAQMPMEAIECGLLIMREEQACQQTHLGMSEASLALNDPENAVAHAEEALEMAGSSGGTSEGCEALLLIALGSWSQWETETAERAAHRVTAAAQGRGDRRMQRFGREARMLLYRFTGPEEDL